MNVVEQVIFHLKQFFGLSEEEEALVRLAEKATVNTCLALFAVIDQPRYRNIRIMEDIHPLHSGQYTMFLYYLSRDVLCMNAPCSESIADKLYYINKSLNGVDLFHQIDLPKIMFMEHPLGSVMGRASYSNGFVFQQGCTVGGNVQADGRLAYPVLGKNVRMFANSLIIGNSHIGENVYIAAQSLVKDEDVPANSIVFGQSPKLIIKPRDASYFEDRSLFIGSV